MHGANGVQEYADFSALAEEAAGPGAQRLEDVLVDLESGQDEHAYAGQIGVGGDQAGGGQPVEFGHADVHDDDVGLALAGQIDGLPAGARLADDGQVLGGVDEHGESAADQR